VVKRLINKVKKPAYSESIKKKGAISHTKCYSKAKQMTTENWPLVLATWKPLVTLTRIIFVE
jgi:hypothetical protein